MFKAFKQSFIAAILGNLLVAVGVIWGLYEIISWFTTKDTDAIDAVDFNFFWLIGIGAVLFVGMFIRAFTNATKEF